MARSNGTPGGKDSNFEGQRLSGRPFWKNTFGFSFGLVWPSLSVRVPSTNVCPFIFPSNLKRMSSKALPRNPPWKYITAGMDRLGI